MKNYETDLSGNSLNLTDEIVDWSIKLSFDICDLGVANFYSKDSILYQLEIENNVIKNCVFEENILIEIKKLSHAIKFEDCTFKKQLLITGACENIDVHSGKIINFILEGGSVKEFVIRGLKANCKFYINPQGNKKIESLEIETFKIENSQFLENFKLHNCKVKELIIDDTDFEKNADFYKSSFLTKTANCFNAINFKKLALFGETHFEGKLIFKYVTFEGMCHFNSAVLDNGLDLEYTNIKENINFYGIKIGNQNNTSQETYRIIKHNFEKLGNKIEANRYHALELAQKRIELKNDKSSDWKERWVFNLHHWSSVHSTNWFRVILWILFVGILTIGFVNIRLIIELIFNPSLFKIEYIFKAWTELCQFIYIGYMEDKLKDHPLTFLFNKISLGYLYYQFLMSVRKDTRK